MEKYNLIISSANRLSTDSISNINVDLEQSLIARDDEYFTVNMIQFNTIKAFYAVQKDLNSNFQVILYNNQSEVFDTIDNEIPEGNYNVFTLKDTIASQTLNNIQIEYDSKLNKYIFKKIVNPLYTVYLKCINSGVFFGLENGVQYLITDEGMYSSKFINISGYENMVINISGDIDIENSITNISNPTYVQSQILGIIPIANVAPMDTISYNNCDGGINYNYKIHNRYIRNLKIQITNERGVEFPQISDYLLSLQFIRHKKDNSSNVLTEINKKLEDIAYFLTHLIKMLSNKSS